MTRSVVPVLAALALAGCAGGDEAASTGTAPGTGSAATTTGRATPPRTGATRAPHLGSKTALERVRALMDRFSVVDERLGEGVRAVSGFDSKVHCWTPEGWRRLAAPHGAAPEEIAGVADIFSLEIHLRPEVCDALHALLEGERPQVGTEALAAAGSLVALTHEGMHLTSVGSNEVVAECRAMQNAYEVGVRLGIEEEYGRRLALIYWEELYRPHDPVYGSPECTDGGSLDINPDTPDWP
jgi:hypothetical protein